MGSQLDRLRTASTADSNQLRLGHRCGGVADDARVIAAVNQLQRVDAQNAGERINLQRFDLRRDGRVGRRVVHHPTHR